MRSKASPWRALEFDHATFVMARCVAVNAFGEMPAPASGHRFFSLDRKRSVAVSSNRRLSEELNTAASPLFGSLSSQVEVHHIGEQGLDVHLVFDGAAADYINYARQGSRPR